MSDVVNLVAAASEADVRTGLRAAVALGRLAETLEALNVTRARSEGWSWEEIAGVLGVTRQGVHKKYAAVVPASPVRRPKEG